MTRLANVTYRINWNQDGLGEPRSSLSDYSGCIGELQRNESDLMIREVTFPLPAVNIDQGMVVWDTGLAFMSTYAPPDSRESHYTQVTSVLSSFDGNVWSLCILVSLTLYLTALASRASTLRKYKYTRTYVIPDHQYLMYQVVTHIIATGCLFSANRVSKKILFMTMCLFPLLVLFYLKSTINTELVISKKPSTFSSYQDLLDKGVSVTFHLTSDAYLLFKFAQEGSIEKKLWDASKSKLPEDQILVKTSLDALTHSLSSVVNHKTTFILESIWLPINLQYVCAAIADQMLLDMFASDPDNPNFRLKSGTFIPYYRQDVSSRIIRQQFILNSRPSNHLKRTKRAIRRILESGVNGIVKNIMTDTVVMHKQFTGPSRSLISSNEIVQKCMNNEIITSHPDHVAISFENLSVLAVSLAISYFLLLVILLCEVFAHSLCVCLSRVRHHTSSSHLVDGKARDRTKQGSIRWKLFLHKYRDRCINLESVK